MDMVDFLQKGLSKTSKGKLKQRPKILLLLRRSNNDTDLRFQSRVVQCYVMREEAGTLAPNKFDKNKVFSCIIYNRDQHLRTTSYKTIRLKAWRKTCLKP